MVTAEILPFRENFHGRTGNGTRDLMISSQRLRPLDHEAGHMPKLFAIEIGAREFLSSFCHGMRRRSVW